MTEDGFYREWQKVVINHWQENLELHSLDWRQEYVPSRLPYLSDKAKLFIANDPHLKDTSQWLVKLISSYVLERAMGLTAS